MEIKVDANTILRLIDAIKKLPVNCDFDAADRWVGVVMLLQSLLQNEEEPEVIENGE